MSFVREFKYSLILIVFVLSIIIIFAFTNSVKLQVIGSLFSIILGSSLVMFGFWGADFAFGIANGDIKQQREKGIIKGTRKKVYVPFMRNYTPLEWWNLNWLITFIGCLLIAIGMFIMGIVFGVNCYSLGSCTLIF